MYRKTEREFQYAPGIVKIIEDVVGGGTIDRESLANAIYSDGPLDELPPFAVVVKDPATGLWHVLKTAKVASGGGSGTTYKVEKGHAFGVGDFVTIGGDLNAASDKITVIDRTNKEYDTITVAGTIGSASQGQVLMQVKDKQSAQSAKLQYDGEFAITMSKVDLTVANQSAGLLIRGTVTEACVAFPIDAAIKAKMPFIRFV